MCDRLEVDNSGRTSHGALLDTELQADVFFNLTRGQDVSLIDDSSANEASGNGSPLMDLRVFNLPVLSANEQELAAHEVVLKQINKDSKGKTVWRVLEPVSGE